ncbi:hypothetical protein [Calycomorphotria hydatis]|uniref:Uncharacterized protein n=1 Tax=Calycomorphotria hydatis TaxID=2528027 RepID=A0A517T7R4_9PLAN|nr:hypothetical protein [Calycomorphotria hydatis]QDT64409.1 hypothetical protein V22_16430 [Calycomorphotria hydatis]
MLRVSLSLVLLLMGMSFASAGLFDEIFGHDDADAEELPYGKFVTAQPVPAPTLAKPEPRRGVEYRRALFQTPAPAQTQYPVMPAPDFLPPAPQGTNPPAMSPPVMAAPIGLYPHVKYEDLEDVYPQPVVQIVQVMDPNPPPVQPCLACPPPQPGVVFVQVCVPPGECKRVKVTHRGAKVSLDYGKYEVDIVSRDGVVFVDYDD